MSDSEKFVALNQRDSKSYRYYEKRGQTKHYLEKLRPRMFPELCKKCEGTKTTHETAAKKDKKTFKDTTKTCEDSTKDTSTETTKDTSTDECADCYSQVVAINQGLGYGAPYTAPYTGSYGAGCGPCKAKPVKCFPAKTTGAAVLQLPLPGPCVFNPTLRTYVTAPPVLGGLTILPPLTNIASGSLNAVCITDQAFVNFLLNRFVLATAATTPALPVGATVLPETTQLFLGTLPCQYAPAAAAVAIPANVFVPAGALTLAADGTVTFTAAIPAEIAALFPAEYLASLPLGVAVPATGTVTNPRPVLLGQLAITIDNAGNVFLQSSLAASAAVVEATPTFGSLLADIIDSLTGLANGLGGVLNVDPTALTASILTDLAVTATTPLTELTADQSRRLANPLGGATVSYLSGLAGFITANLPAITGSLTSIITASIDGVLAAEAIATAASAAGAIGPLLAIAASINGTVITAETNFAPRCPCCKEKKKADCDCRKKSF